LLNQSFSAKTTNNGIVPANIEQETFQLHLIHQLKGAIKAPPLE